MKDNIKLIIFPVNSHLFNIIKTSITKILKTNKIKTYKITNEKSFLVIDVHDYLQVSHWLEYCPGIKKIGIAVSTQNNIKDILNTIVHVTNRIVSSKNYFNIDVFSENPKFIPRDIEFMATGLMMEKSKINNLKSTRFKDDDVTKVYCYISKSNCYVVYKFIEGIGGLPFGYFKKKILCICYDTYSLKSIETISNFGFIPEILIIYSNTSTLTGYLKRLYHVFLKMQMKQISLKLLRIYINTDNNFSHLDELILLQTIFELTNTTDVLIPFSFYKHPFYVIEKIIKFCYQNGKIPWLPFVFLDLNKNSKLFVKDSSIFESFEKKNKFFTQQISSNMLRYRRRLVLNDIKSISFAMTSSDIRPNYIDNILNSI